MFKSFINPQKIIGNGTKAANPEAFSNFMSGGKAALGSSVSSAAANNISSFARSGVAPAGNANITPLITNISTSIVNNVDNSVSNVINSFKTQIQSVLGGVQSNLSATIQNFSKDYQQRIQNKEDNKPSNILKGFLGLYQNAINFVTFFGDSKNNKKIEFTLKSLRNMFSDSFNTAAIIRQTIVKIVKQLSNLPTASGASGGLNLDVKVPGGALKQSGRATLSKFAGSRGGKLFGAGVVGAGAVGLGMMGMQSAKASQEEKLAETAKKGVGGEDKPNDFMKGLNSIAERFSDAIDSLLGRSKKPPGGGGAASSSGAGAGTAGAGGIGPSVPSPGSSSLDNAKSGKIQGLSEEDYKYLGMVSAGEAGPGDDPYAVAASILNRMAEGRGKTVKDIIMAPGQYEAVTGSGAHPAFSPKLEEMFKSPEGQAKLVAALERLQGRTDFKGQSLLDKRVASEDPMVDAKGNYYHYSWQKSPSSVTPAGWSQPNWKKFIEKPNITSSAPKNGISATSLQSTPTPSTVIPQAAQKPASTVNAAPPTQKAQEVSQAVTAPPGQNVNDVKVASMPAEFTNISLGGSQDGGGAVASLPAPSFAGPNVAEYGDTRNNNHPNLYSSVILGIIA